MNAGFVILLVISGWALLSIMVAATVGKAAGQRDVEAAAGAAGMPFLAYVKEAADQGTKTARGSSSDPGYGFDVGGSLPTRRKATAGVSATSL